MRLTKFILIAAGVTLLYISSLFADEAKMAKGLEIFNETAGCAACHVLKAAGSEGNVGPNLDTVEMTKESLTEMVVYGLGVMPAFGEDEILTKEEIDTVVYYVLNSAGK
jgi:mono/diheme cytochrome c family protein